MKMNNKRIRIAAALLVIILTASALTGCANKADNGENSFQSGANQENNQNNNQNPDDNLLDEGDIIGDNGAIAFRPSECGILSKEKYEYPYMGMNVVLTKDILTKMDSRDVILLSSEDYTADGNLKYAAMYWYALTEEQKNEVATAFDPDAWRAGLEKIGTLGVYHADVISELDTLTGCTEHKELGKSEDGNYVYYLSFADGADTELKSELEKTEVTLIKMQKIDLYMGNTAFSEGRVNTANVGEFKTKDVNGKEYTQDIFKDYDLTLVNVFTTWCSACIDEMPELEEFNKTMKAMGINVVGIVYDTVNETGNVDEGAIDTAKLLQKKAGLTFPLLMPDETDMNGRLKGIDGFPESFFVDKDGNIVGETYMGARAFEEWKEIAENELANLKGTN